MSCKILQPSAQCRKSAVSAWTSSLRIHRDAIERLPSSRREQYARLGRQGADPRAEVVHAPELIEIRKEIPLWANHLFVDGNGKFGWKANSWEGTRPARGDGR